MLRVGAVTFSAMALTVLPAGAACGAETAPAAALAPAFQPHPHFRSQFRFHATPAWPALAPATEARPAPQIEGAATAATPGDVNRYSLVSGAGSSLDFNAKSYASRPGWAFSGRVGPLRWLTPLDSEGDTKLRFGGRVPGQPRLPGMGLFNVGVHYAFE